MCPGIKWALNRVEVEQSLGVFRFYSYDAPCESWAQVPSQVQAIFISKRR